MENINGTIPFDINYTPVRLRIPVKKIEWELEDNRFTPALPKQGHLTLLSEKTEYIDLVPYGCTELRLTVFPDADAKPQTAPETPDYTRPADAPDCVEVVDGHYAAYFELPRFCWDEPIYCKVRTENGSNDLHSNKNGDLCEQVGTTANGRHIWRWTGPAVDQPAPVELIFTNHDCLTHAMPFANNGYYNYDHLIYKAGQTSPTSINNTVNSHARQTDTYWYTLDGKLIPTRPMKKGVYIHQGKIRILDVIK